jgi:hypothetical protein
MGREPRIDDGARRHEQSDAAHEHDMVEIQARVRVDIVVYSPPGLSVQLATRQQSGRYCLAAQEDLAPKLDRIRGARCHDEHHPTTSRVPASTHGQTVDDEGACGQDCGTEPGHVSQW